MTDWVLLVPGFAASHLWKVDFLGDRRVKIWLSQFEVALTGISGLDTSAEVAPPTLDKTQPFGLVREVYQPFMATMARAGVPVFQFAYDWRADCQTNGQRLAEVIEAHVGSQARFTIVTHSAGGLVAQAALPRLSDAALATVRRLVTCACPWQGSFRTLELLAGVHETVLRVIAPSSFFGPATYMRRQLESLRIIAGWPGVYDLLPMPELMAKYPPGEGQDFRTLEFWAKANPHFNLDEYDRAIARRPIQFATPPSVEHINVRGVGAYTSGPSPTVVDGEPDHWFRALLGDGAVPEFSATAPNILGAVNREMEAEHEQFLNSFQLRFLLAQLMGFEF